MQRLFIVNLKRSVPDGREFTQDKFKRFAKEFPQVAEDKVEEVFGQFKQVVVRQCASGDIPQLVAEREWVSLDHNFTRDFLCPERVAQSLVELGIQIRKLNYFLHDVVPDVI